MDSTNSFSKVFHSALIIKPPQDKWNQIQEIRKIHDKAYERWMPHINMSFPFVQPEKFSDAAKLLQQEFQDFEEFEIEFKVFDNFTHGKSSVLYLKPQVNENQLQLAQQKIQKVFPFLDDLSKKGEGGFAPHLTCGQFSSNQIEKVKKQYQEKYAPIKFTCSELCLITRDGQDAPFIVKEVVTLKKKQIKQDISDDF
ncbi:2'-5' RNA ligase family protein (macronuclear) [Tetrahymena thermophila SB210]|uniref:2'-5' RNA ligase family protein n=1 Tax=Tetrahymena thermophila (strain SB210) TaxID=312017 RepID=Q23D36_TETTS|nr:2'-5' RNA ligase family protein [Tetrahymena thermophila SB210]EAR94356.1 2'-5' RNA ligase family protein [Tetrahymena thermophila SB210]|eukprot:XP_001014850.1 2'-5' RNA ligase family protein [Tetrahymena thermophila SB210]